MVWIFSGPGCVGHHNEVLHEVQTVKIHFYNVL